MMNPVAIPIAKSRLRNASRALAGLHAAVDDEEFVDHWTAFLTSWKGVYSVLEQGAKNSPQSRQWFGGIKAKRKADPLLQYLFEARNDEQHGLVQSVAHTDAHRHLMRTTREVTSMRAVYNGGGLVGMVGPDGEPCAEIVQYIPPGPELKSVKARGDVLYHPPTEHLGNDVDASPIGVAEAALRYVAALVDEAEARCATAP
ncbi:MAG: hypothetical protein ACRYG4_05775 [Janthinobacterium lividum]